MNEIIKINAVAATQPLYPLWNQCVGAGRANEGLRADWQEQLKTAVRECGFQYIRFHGLLCDDMFVYSEQNGQSQYNWQYVDSLFDTFQHIGIRPIVEFGFMPEALATGTATQFWWKGNITPPKDDHKWAELLNAAVNHWIDRYGIDEVLQWYFEIWNEPNLHGFWASTKSRYFTLYNVSVQAIKSVEERLKVGGPATSNFVPDERFDGETEDTSKHKTFQTENIDTLQWRGVWIKDFLIYCEQNKLPVDFVSAHPYPTDFALDGQKTAGKTRHVSSIKDDMLWLKKVIADSAYPNAEIQLTEWSSSPTSRDYSHDYLPAADYIVKSCIDCAGLAQSLSYWVFTDIFEEAGGPPEPFHGGFGLVNMQGIPKPAFHAYRFLNTLGSKELARGDEWIAAKNTDGKVSFLAYNYTKNLKQAIPISNYPDFTKAEAVQAMGESKTVELELTNLAPCAELLIETLDAENGCVMTKWKQLGCPKNLTPKQTEELNSFAKATKQDIFRADEDGTAKLALFMKPWAIISIRER